MVRRFSCGGLHQFQTVLVDMSCHCSLLLCECSVRKSSSRKVYSFRVGHAIRELCCHLPEALKTDLNHSLTYAHLIASCCINGRCHLRQVNKMRA